MRMIIGGKCTDSIIEAVEAYANKRVDDALEVAAETTQELTKAIVEDYERALDEANEYIAELEAKVEELQKEVRNLVIENIGHKEMVVHFRRDLNMVVDDRNELHKIVEDIKEAIAKYRMKEGLGELYSYFEEDKFEQPDYDEEDEVQPDCCAAGHCGTDECGEHCKDDEGFDTLEDLFRF